MKLGVLAGSVPVLVLLACGPTPPDYGRLAGHTVDVCGTVFGADEIVRRAYDGAATGELPAEVPFTSGAVAASVNSSEDGTTVRRYPCARNVNEALVQLAEMGYRDAVRVDGADDERVFEFRAVDPYGLEGVYTLFDCNFVGEVESRRSGSLIEQGLFGAFGENGGQAVDDEMIRSLSAFTFATGMTGLAWEGRQRFVEGPTLLGSEEAVGSVQIGTEESAAAIGVCVTWVEPDFWGGCDFIRVGISRTAVPDRDNGAFHQLAIHNLLDHHGFPGWCGRME